mmetsp:Transcript_51159/g.119903  ORF Transcript_51159/g.119903 Transcript_51159/m.119903 type:complete len:213 (+) Transcript_51159:662-1300(+)
MCLAFVLFRSIPTNQCNLRSIEACDMWVSVHRANLPFTTTWARRSIKHEVAIREHVGESAWLNTLSCGHLQYFHVCCIVTAGTHPHSHNNLRIHTATTSKVPAQFTMAVVQTVSAAEVCLVRALRISVGRCTGNLVYDDRHLEQRSWCFTLAKAHEARRLIQRNGLGSISKKKEGIFLRNLLTHAILDECCCVICRVAIEIAALPINTSRTA